MPPLRFDLLMPRRVAPFALPALCLLVSVPLKAFFYAGGPLWLDEGWTLAIVQAPLFGPHLIDQGGAGFLRQLLDDPNPPFYFVTLKAWTALAGLSDGALRAPSVLAAIGAPLFALAPGTGLARREKLLWMALLALWVPGIFFAQEARSYALLFALECAAAAAFLRLLARPALREAFAWCGITALCLLTHHHALLLGALQGFAFLILRRREALKLWPAALLFLPAFAWVALHAERVADFAKPEFTWYPPMEPGDAIEAIDYGFGGRPIWVGAGAFALIALVWLRFSPSAKTEITEDAPPAWQWAPALCALLGLAIVVVVGYLRPSFAFRYLTPYGPGLLLALPLLLKATARDRATIFGASVMSFALFIASLLAMDKEPNLRRTLQYEHASTDMMLAHAHRVVFLWDNPTNRILKPEERLALARTFFDRAHYPVEVVAITTGEDDEPAELLYDQLKKPGDGFIWLYDRDVPRTAADGNPPRYSPERPDLACATYAPDDNAMGVLACQKRAPAAPLQVSPPKPGAPRYPAHDGPAHHP